MFQSKRQNGLVYCKQPRTRTEQSSSVFPILDAFTEERKHQKENVKDNIAEISFTYENPIQKKMYVGLCVTTVHVHWNNAAAAGVLCILYQ